MNAAAACRSCGESGHRLIRAAPQGDNRVLVPARGGLMDTMEKYRRYVNTYFLKKVQPIVIDRALGAKVWDESGREFVDLFSGISVVNAGHGRPEIVAAAQAQMQRLVHSNSYLDHNRPTAYRAEALAWIMPS